MLSLLHSKPLARLGSKKGSLLGLLTLSRQKIAPCQTTPNCQLGRNVYVCAPHKPPVQKGSSARGGWRNEEIKTPPIARFSLLAAEEVGDIMDFLARNEHAVNKVILTHYLKLMKLTKKLKGSC